MYAIYGFQEKMHLYDAAILILQVVEQWYWFWPVRITKAFVLVYARHVCKIGAKRGIAPTAELQQCNGKSKLSLSVEQL